MNYKLYDNLGLKKTDNPTDADIKSAYKKYAMKYHPDKNKNNKEISDKFKDISHSYSILSDVKKKREYDQLGDNGYVEGNNGGGINPEDIFEQIFRSHGGNMGGFGGMGGMGGMGGRFSHNFASNDQNEENSKCNTIHKTLNVGLEDVYNGIKNNMTLNILKHCLSCNTICNNCNGKGIIKQVKSMGILTQIFQGACDICNGTGIILKASKNCNECSGKGTYTKDISANLSIPKGFTNNYKTIFKGMGEQPKNKHKKSGDLIIELNIQQHKNFIRKGNDLYYKTEISYIDSVIGKEIEIPYFSNSIKINTLKYGILSNNNDYLIENKGLPVQNKDIFGDMYIEFKINYPKIKDTSKIEELKLLLKSMIE
tara:strand:+ start:1076 stop:2182 length:1107 start_codon:yes stop_codon:yes gene_type:complete